MKDNALYYAFTEQNPLLKFFGNGYPHDHICLKLSATPIPLNDGRTIISYDLNVYPCSKDKVVDGKQLWAMDISPLRATTIPLYLAQADTSEARAAIVDAINTHAQYIIAIYLSAFEHKLLHVGVATIVNCVQEFWSQHCLPLRDLILSYNQTHPTHNETH